VKGKPRRSYIEKLLTEVRREPSPKCNDPRQLDLIDAVKQQAFANLDREIRKALD
jgi:hypothetical protein